MKKAIYFLKSLVMFFTIVLNIIQAKSQNFDSSFFSVDSTFTLDTNIFIEILSKQISFQKIFSKGEGKCVIKDSLGNFFVAGRIESDASLIKIDSVSNVVWQHTYVNGVTNVIKKIPEGFILSGTTYDVVGAICAVFLIKTDSVGHILWVKIYKDNGTGSSFVSKGYDLLVVDDGYIICGETRGFSCSNQGIFIIKTSFDGSLIWSKIYSNWAVGKSILETTNGDYVICGNLGNSVNGSLDIFLLRINSIGNIIWLKTYGGINTELGFSVTSSVDGFVVVGSNEASSFYGDNNIFVLKTDTVGNLSWNKSIGNSNYEMGYNVFNSGDNFIISGFSSDSVTSNDRICLIKIDINGNIIWSKLIDNSFSAWNSVYSGILDKNCYVFTGFGDDFIYVVKTDTSGHTACGTEDIIMPSFSNIISVDTLSAIATNVLPIVINPILNEGTPLSYSNLICFFDTTFTDTIIVVDTIVCVQDKNKEQNAVIVYPNPAFNRITILNGEGKMFFVYNSICEMVLQRKISKREEIINFNLPTGFYVYHIGTIRQKFMIIKK